MSGRVSCDIVCTWQEALKAVEQRRLAEARKLFWDIRHFSAKIWFNLSIVEMLSGDLEAADEKLQECVHKDGYLAVAHFQRGVIAYLQGRSDLYLHSRLTQAKEMFAEAEKHMRIGDMIDYRQLGLALRLTRQQIEHNKSAIEARLKTHNSTTEVKVDELETLPYSLFCPAKSLVDNLNKKEFLSKSKVISSLPDSTQVKKTVEVSRQSSSAPSSPTSSRKHLVAPVSLYSTHSSPPRRPPPRLTLSNSKRLEALSLSETIVMSNNKLQHSTEAADKQYRMHQQPASAMLTAPPSFIANKTSSTLSDSCVLRNNTHLMLKPAQCFSAQNCRSRKVAENSETTNQNRQLGSEQSSSVKMKTEMLNCGSGRRQALLTPPVDGGQRSNVANAGLTHTQKPKPARPPPPKPSS